jgi:RNA polymerase sigma-70 factor (ECF subfamily)
MLEDKILVWKLNCGNTNALSYIYEKYRDDLLRLAIALLNNIVDAEDIVQDVFLNFAESTRHFHLTGSLKGYLATCFANKARNRNLSIRRRKVIELNKTEHVAANPETPDRLIMNFEEMKQISGAIAQLPYQQREAITLHLYGDMKFREIAKLQEVSIKTVQSRYRCGLDKLRSQLNSEVDK